MTTEDTLEWNDDETLFFKPETKGQSIVGKVVGAEQINNSMSFEIKLLEEQAVPVSDGDGGVDVRQLSVGTTVFVGYATVKNFLKKRIEHNDVVKLTYESDEEAKSSGNTMKMFDTKWMELERYKER